MGCILRNTLHISGPRWLDSTVLLAEVQLLHNHDAAQQDGVAAPLLVAAESSEESCEVVEMEPFIVLVPLVLAFLQSFIYHSLFHIIFLYVWM